MTTNFEELEKLAKLKEQWILSEEEFEVEKKKILSWESESIKSSPWGHTETSTSKTYHDSSNDTFFQKIFSSKWRINRREYFVYYILLMLFYFLVIFILAIFSEYILKEEISEGLINALAWLLYITYLIISIKRLHDANYRGWWILFPWVWVVLPFVSWTKWDNRFWNESKVNDNILNPLFIVSLFILIIWFIGIIVFAILLSEEEKIPVNTNTQVETITCWKNSALGEDGKCHCLSWYKRENYEDANNFDCIKN